MPNNLRQGRHPSQGRRMLKVAFIVTGAVAMLAAGIGVYRMHRAMKFAGAGHRESSAIRVELGAQLPGQLLVRRINVVNTGSTPLRFTHIASSCGCLQSSLNRAVVPPGGKATLRLALGTHMWSGPAIVTAALLGNRGSHAVALRYHFYYTVRRLIRLGDGGPGNSAEPYYLDLGAITAGDEPKPFRVVVTRGSYPTPWDKWRCTVSDAALAAKVKRLGKNRWQLSLTPRKTTEVLGSQSYLLHFSFYRGGTKLPYHYAQPVNFTVRGPVELRPENLFFGVTTRGATVVKGLRIVDSRTGLVGGTILRAVCMGPGRVTTSITERGKSLLASFRGTGLNGRAAGHLVVTAALAGRRYQFRVDYLAYVLPAGPAR